MSAVKIRRGVLYPLLALLLTLALFFLSSTSPNVAEQLKQFAGYTNPEGLDDEGEDLTPELAQVLADESTNSGTDQEDQLRQLTKIKGDQPIYVLAPKDAPKVPKFSKDTIKDGFSFRIYSHNVKNGAHTDLVKGELAWKYRRAHVVSSIKAHAPANSIIALQEPVKFQLDEVVNALNRNAKEAEWSAYGGGRIDGVAEGEAVPIIVRNSEWEVLFSDTFWLNEVDERSSITGWDGKYPRIATCVTLKHRQSGNYVNVFNTHLDHKGTWARKEAAALLVAKMKTINDWPSFLVGDFNAIPNDASYKKLTGLYADCHTLVNEENRYGHHEWTVTGFLGQFALDAKRIDYIFAPPYVKKEWDTVCEKDEAFALRLKGYGLMHSKFGGVYMSDHRPLVADFEFQKC